MRQLHALALLSTTFIFASAAGAQSEGQYQGYQPAYQGQAPGMAVGGPQYAPPTGPMQGSPPSQGLTIGQWFGQYDQIRRQAQMSPAERQQADSLMSRGLSILVPGENKIATK